MTRGDFVLVPRDGLFCKDGRGWFTSGTGRGHALEWPYPSTILGALRSTWGRAREQSRARPFRGRDWPAQTGDLRLGPTLPLCRAWGEPWSESARVWPVPADARVVEGGAIERLEPRPPSVSTLGSDDDPARERLWTARGPRTKSAPSARWWTDEAFVAWLCGAREGDPGAQLELHRRIQTHVAISPDTKTALEQQLYSHEIVETLGPEAQWGLGCRVSADDMDPIATATLGSDRRLAAVEAVEPSVFAVPETLLGRFGEGVPGLRLFVVTPAAFEGGWLPAGLSARGDEYRGRLPGLDVELVLRAAFVGRPVAVSGWDMAKGKPKPCTRAVPPGSVYAFTRADGGSFNAEHARALWLAAVGERRGEGFGVVVPGVWTPQPPLRS